MASWCEARRRRGAGIEGRAKAWALVGLVVGAIGCRPVLPTVDPAEDPSEAGAEASPWSASPSPYETSAFEGVKLRGGGHGHHGHHGHGGGAKKADQSKDAKATETEAEAKPEADDETKPATEHQHGGTP